MKSLTDLFEHQLKDLYSAETQIEKLFPKVIKKANDAKLKKAFEKHLKETKEQKSRLQQACKEMGIKPTGSTCKAMAGLVKETEGFLKEKATDEVMDAGLIAELQRIEHYEISGYGTAVRYATELGHKKVASLLKKTLKEEYGADDKLNKMAEDRLNRKAKADKKEKEKAKKEKAAAKKKAAAKSGSKAKAKKSKKSSAKSTAKKSTAKKKSPAIKSKSTAKKKYSSTKKTAGRKLTNPLTVPKDEARSNRKAASKKPVKK